MSPATSRCSQVSERNGTTAFDKHSPALAGPFYHLRYNITIYNINHGKA